MAKVSISEAARLSGISRTNLYKNYVKAGKITVEQDHAGKPQIDTAEILRVFGELKKTQDYSNPVTEKTQMITEEKHNENSVFDVELRAVREMLKVREEQLSEAQERERWMQRQIEELTSTVRQIEDKSQSKPAEEQKKGWLARLFS